MNLRTARKLAKRVKGRSLTQIDQTLRAPIWGRLARAERRLMRSIRRPANRTETGWRPDPRDWPAYVLESLRERRAGMLWLRRRRASYNFSRSPMLYAGPMVYSPRLLSDGATTPGAP